MALDIGSVQTSGLDIGSNQTAAVSAPTATGALSILIPTMAGVGAVGAKVATGALSILIPTVVGVGSASVPKTATGALSILVPTVAGVGEVGNKTATGALSILVPTIAGVGTLASPKTATGALTILVPTMAGVGLVGEKTAIGALTILIPTVAGVGVIGIKSATGALTMLVPTVAGVGAVGAKTATGALSILIPTIAGVGEVGRKTATGALTMLVPTIAGVALIANAKTATGALSILLPTIAGTGVRAAAVGIYEATSNKIRRRFGTEVEDVLSIPIQYDNRTITTPSTGLWIRLAVEHEDTEKKSVGGNQTYELHGMMRTTIKAPLAEGDFNARSAAQTILTAFDGKKVEAVEYGAGSVSPTGRDGRWYQVDVAIPFSFSFKERVTLRRHTGVALTSDQVGDSIRKWFGEKVTDTVSIATQFDDAPFTQPDTNRWCWFTILEGDPIPVGTRGDIQVHRHVGVAVAQVFDRLQVGDGESLAVVDTIAIAFRSVSIDGITFRAPQVQTIGEGRAGRFWQINVSAPFSYETTSTL